MMMMMMMRNSLLTCPLRPGELEPLSSLARAAAASFPSAKQVCATSETTSQYDNLDTAGIRGLLAGWLLGLTTADLSPKSHVCTQNHHRSQF